MDDRDNLRKGLRARRKAARAQHLDAARELFAQFKKIDFPAKAVCAGYIAMASEIDPALILKFLSELNIPLCLPVVVGENMPLQFRSYKAGDVLNADNRYQIPEPAGDQQVLMPDLLLVPLLGFDRTGHRIGSGKGFYDYTLASLRAQKNITAIGLAYAEQELFGIMDAPHDQPLNIIVTPREVIYCPGV